MPFSFIVYRLVFARRITQMANNFIALIIYDKAFPTDERVVKGFAILYANYKTIEQ